MSNKKIFEFVDSIISARTPLNWKFDSIALYFDPQKWGFYFNAMQKNGWLDIQIQDWRAIRIYNSTPALAVDRFVSLVINGIAPPDQIYQMIKFKDPKLNESTENQQWTDKLSTLIFEKRYEAGSGFSNALKLAVYDMALFGFSGVFIDMENKDNDTRFTYRHVPAKELFFSVDVKNRAKVVIRKLYLTSMQIFEQFGYDDGQTLNAQSNNEIHHIVIPNEDHDALSFMPTKKKFKSIYRLKNGDIVLAESGYDVNPYIPIRIELDNTGVYGVGIGEKVYPDVQTLNQYELLRLEQTAKQVNPPVLIADDFEDYNQLDLGPNAINPKGYNSITGQPNIIPFNNHGNSLPADRVIEVFESRIKDAFFNSEYQYQEQRGNPATALEVQYRYQQKLQQGESKWSLIKDDLFETLIMIEINYLDKLGYIPPPPEPVSIAGLQIVYTGALLTLNHRNRALEDLQIYQNLQSMAQTSPEVSGIINSYKFLNGSLSNIFKPEYLNNQREYEAIQQQIQQQVQNQQQLQELMSLQQIQGGENAPARQ